MVLRGCLDAFDVDLGRELDSDGTVDMSSVSMLERLDLLYVIRLNIHAPYTAESKWISHKNQSLFSGEFIARRCWYD
jgi:hypothetical protein